MCHIQYSYWEYGKEIPTKSTSDYILRQVTHSHYYCPQCGYQEQRIPGPINTMQELFEENKEEEFDYSMS